MENPKDTWIWCLHWILFAIATSLVFLRLLWRNRQYKKYRTDGIISASRRRRSTAGNSSRPLLASDFFTVIAWLLYVPCITMVYIANKAERVAEKKILIQWIANEFYVACLFAVKAAVLCSYREFIWRPKALAWLGWLQAFTAATFVCLMGLDAACLIMHYRYNSDPPRLNGWDRAMYYAGHISTDILIYLFPIPTILPLIRGDPLLPNNKISTSKKIGVMTSFTAGFLCIAMAILMLISAHAKVGSLQMNLVVGAMELCYALFVPCAPALVACIASICRRNSNKMQGLARVSSGGEVRSDEEKS